MANYREKNCAWAFKVFKKIYFNYAYVGKEDVDMDVVTQGSQRHHIPGTGTTGSCAPPDKVLRTRLGSPTLNRGPFSGS